jgi:DNA polymerase I-like protein with 3'-5' exonuclease and polymerase domains
MRFKTVAPPPIYVDNADAIQESIRRCSNTRLLGVDTESLGREDKYIKMVDQVVNMGLSPDEDTRYFIPRRYLHHYRPLLAGPVPKALHNYKWDAHRLANAGLEIGGPLYETLIMDFLFDEDLRENKHSLDDCARDYFGIPMAKYKDVMGDEDPWTVVPGHPRFLRYLDYGSLDPWVTRKLALLHKENLHKIKLYDPEDFQVDVDDGTISPEELQRQLNWSMLDHYWRYEEPQVKALYRMERRGIRIDKDHLTDVAKSLEAEMDQAAAELSRIAGHPLNPNSPKQMGEWLFNELGLEPLKRTNTGNPSVDEDTLKHFAELGVEGCFEAISYKKASKLKGTYAVGLLKWIYEKDGRIHTNYSPVKVTGRLGSNNPNLQNIPRPSWDTHGIRKAFVPDTDDDILLVVDYGQLEMRILASAAEAYGDPTMAQGIRDGLDMHSYTGAMMIGITYKEFVALKDARDEFALAIRQAAKAINFGIVYGIAAQGLSKQLSDALKRIVSESEAQGYIDKYLEAFPGVKMYMAAQKADAQKKGRVQTIAGRFRRLSSAKSRKPLERSYALRQAINAPIQGSAADIVKAAMIILENDAYLREELGCTLRMQVHDEFVFNIKGGRNNPSLISECTELIKEVMEGIFSHILTVPLIADPAAVLTWSEAK